MSKLFRRRASADVGLPTTTAAAGPKRSSFLIRSNPNDGSARNIRLNRSLTQVWKQLPTVQKVSYILCIVFLFTIYWGIRSIRYHNQHIHLNCHSTECKLSILDRGWGSKVLLEFPRRQLVDSLAVKTDRDGTFVSAHPPLTEAFSRNQGKKGKHATSASAHYKGPDADGYYTSYAIILRDQATADRLVESPEQETAPDGAGGEDEPAKTTPLPAVDLAPLADYLQDLGEGQYRLIMKLHQLGQSKRRVRTILTKIESYIKRRRQSLLVKEHGAPSWQGVLGIVLGIVGFLLTILIGQFWEEDDRPPPGGPGARRHSSAPPVDARRESMKRQTPARYEVRTKPAVATSAVSRKATGAPSTRIKQ